MDAEKGLIFAGNIFFIQYFKCFVYIRTNIFILFSLKIALSDAINFLDVHVVFRHFRVTIDSKYFVKWKKRKKIYVEFPPRSDFLVDAQCSISSDRPR